MNLFEDMGASFSDCRKYRYALWRIWDRAKPLAMFIGLNPSTADENKPDPTITRVRDFAASWGFGGFYMMNLFAYITAYPEELLSPYANVGENDFWLNDISKKCSKIFYVWGNFKVAEDRSKEILDRFPEGYALVINKNGSPRHPLYVKANTIPLKYPSSNKESR